MGRNRNRNKKNKKQQQQVAPSVPVEPLSAVQRGPKPVPVQAQQSGLEKRGIVAVVEWLPGKFIGLTKMPSRKAVFFYKLFFDMKFTLPNVAGQPDSTFAQAQMRVGKCKSTVSVNSFLVDAPVANAAVIIAST